MSGFANSILGGAAKLIRRAIQSPDYIHEVSGWTINKDGSAEFSDLEIRGTFKGNDFIVNPDGIFFYAGTAANGNLLTSNAPNGGVDPFGNPYHSGIVIYGGNGNPYLQLYVRGSLPSAIPVLFFASNIASEHSSAQLDIDIGNTGLVNEFIESHWFGPSVSQQPDLARIRLLSSGEDKSFAAGGTLAYQDSTGADWQYLHWNASGLDIPACSLITAKDPSTGSVASPAIPETWHTLGSPSFAGWTSDHGRYRMTPWGDVEIDIHLSGSGTAGTYTYPNSLQAAYIPAITRHYPMAITGNVTAGTNNARIFVSSTGIVQVVLPSVSNAGNTIFVPLD